MSAIINNLQYNFPPIGENLIVGASARPNELTYSEDWLRPDFVPPAAPGGAPAPAPAGPLPAETVSTDPAAGLSGLMTGAGGGS